MFARVPTRHRLGLFGRLILIETRAGQIGSAARAGGNRTTVMLRRSLANASTVFLAGRGVRRTSRCRLPTLRANTPWEEASEKALRPSKIRCTTARVPVPCEAHP